MKMTDSKDLLKKQMKKPGFSREYNALDDEYSLARDILRLRIAAKLTQKDLAKKSGTSQPAIARLESGEYHNLSLSFLRKVGHSLGVVPEVHFRQSH